ncbi:prostatic acid phosphatase-like [Plodia interpunctella]|uniref:prostatic acid phosphatase-like n=1 Tax=Plodia interpunctella TaxID=58824 RepID=UPI0023684F32|nr:prostatic acid phosphatase-like [Plodia interpunctella]
MNIVVCEISLICFLWHFLLGSTHESDVTFSFMVHRHGDRTPSRYSVNYSTSPEELEKLIEPYGYGQLTEKGMQKAYRLGQYIHFQYKSILAPKFNESEIYLRSTDVSRTKMTMLVALAAIYPPVVRWKEDLNWTPVPYTTVPVKTDYNRPTSSCPELEHKMNNILSRKCSEMKPFDDVLALLSEEIGVGFDLREKPLYISQIYNTFEAQESLGLKLTPKVQRALPRIKEAADKAFNIIFRQKDILKYFCGVLLREFHEFAKLVISGSETATVRIYSAHHENVYGISKISRTDISGMPVFASVFSLNLKRAKDDFIVEPVFAYDTPGGVFSFERLDVKDCGEPCFYDKFVELTKKHTLDYDSWRKMCVR